MPLNAFYFYKLTFKIQNSKECAAIKEYVCDESATKMIEIGGKKLPYIQPVNCFMPPKVDSEF